MRIHGAPAPINRDTRLHHDVRYTFDFFCTLDGFGSHCGNWGGYWGKQGSELHTFLRRELFDLGKPCFLSDKVISGTDVALLYVDAVMCSRAIFEKQ